MYPPRRTDPKAIYLEQQRKRVSESPCLSVQYPRLKSLTVMLEYHDAVSHKKRSQLTYMVNLSHAKSVFRFKCPNRECMRGDFELTEGVAEAVTKRRTSASGEMPCKGRTINRVRCPNILHYKLKLEY